LSKFLLSTGACIYYIKMQHYIINIKYIEVNNLFFLFSKPVRDFFCFDDPPGPHDSIEESRVSLV
jgi:hypothetical protein